MIDGLLKEWVGDLGDDEALSCIWRWLKTMMKQVTAVAEKNIELVENICIVEFCIYVHWSWWSQTNIKILSQVTNTRFNFQFIAYYKLT
jgi:hypothetical protein